MAARGAHYTAFVAGIDPREVPNLHASERERLLAAADALLFGDPDVEQTMAEALDLLNGLADSERCSTGRCDSLIEHLEGCGPLPAQTASIIRW